MNQGGGASTVNTAITQIMVYWSINRWLFNVCCPTRIWKMILNDHVVFSVSALEGFSGNLRGYFVHETGQNTSFYSSYSSEYLVLSLILPRLPNDISQWVLWKQDIHLCFAVKLGQRGTQLEFFKMELHFFLLLPTTFVTTRDHNQMSMDSFLSIKALPVLVPILKFWDPSLECLND